MAHADAAGIGTNRSSGPVFFFRLLLWAGAALLIGGAVWYVAAAGIVGSGAWDPAAHGRPPLVTAAAGGLLLIGDIAAWFLLPCFREASAPLKHDLKRDRARYLLLLPGLLLVFVFNYRPMYGIILAFKRFRVKSGILFSEWCGLENFARFFGRSVAWDVIGNTLFIGITQLIITFPVPILLALLLNELRSRRFRGLVQSTIYLPHFVSWVIMFSLVFSLFSVTGGAVNRLLISMGLPTVNLLSDPDMFYGMLYGTSIWKEAGWGTIIYMAAITGVDEEMHEAAYLDGANRFQRCIYITLPSIAFVITTMLILNVGSVMGANFDQIMNLRTDATATTVARVIDTYVYDMGVEKGQYDLATAIGLFQQGVNCVLLFVSNLVVKKMSGEGFF